MAGHDLPEPPIEPRHLFVVSGLNVAQIARKLAGCKGCSERHLARVRRKEKWDEARAEHVRKVSSKVEEVAAESEAMMRARLLKNYGTMGKIALGALAKVSRQIGRTPALMKEDAASLASIARALDTAHKGERSLIDPKDDRVNSIMERAAEIADGKINEIVDWDPEEELQQALKPTAMLDLSYGAAKKEEAEEPEGPLAHAGDDDDE